MCVRRLRLIGPVLFLLLVVLFDRGFLSVPARADGLPREYIYAGDGDRLLVTIGPAASPTWTATSTPTRTNTATATFTPTSTPTPTPIPQGSVLFVVNSVSPLSAGDTNIQNWLVSQGFTVTPYYGCDPVPANAVNNRLIIISTAPPSCFGNPWNGANASPYVGMDVPIIISKAGVLPEFMLTGPTNNANWGNATNQTQVTILNSTSPLAGGLSGTVTVETAAAAFFTWGAPANTASSVASIVGASGQNAIFAYAKGAGMPGSNTAVACRVGAFWSDDAPATFNANGWALFAAAVNWAKGASCR